MIVFVSVAVIALLVGSVFVFPLMNAGAAGDTEIESLTANEIEILETENEPEAESDAGDQEPEIEIKDFQYNVNEEVGSVDVVTTITYDNGQQDRTVSSAVSPIWISHRLQSFVSPEGCCKVTEVEYQFIINLPSNLRIQTVYVDGEVYYCNGKGCDMEVWQYDNACVNIINCDFEFSNANPFLKFNPNDIPFLSQDTTFVFQSRLTLEIFNEDDGRFYTALNDNFNMIIHLPFEQQTTDSVIVQDMESPEEEELGFECPAGVQCVPEPTGSGSGGGFEIISGVAFNEITGEQASKFAGVDEIEVGDGMFLGHCDCIGAVSEIKYLYTDNGRDVCQFLYSNDEGQTVGACEPE